MALLSACQSDLIPDELTSVSNERTVEGQIKKLKKVWFDLECSTQVR